MQRQLHEPRENGVMLKADCGMRNAECGSERKKLRTPNFELRTSTGFTYIALLAAIVIIGISLGSATKYWYNISIRDKEQELLFRGEQYRQAIERYFYAIPATNQYPGSIDDLLKDSRTLAGKRYLRQKFKDPITGEDFVEIWDQNKRIIGVCSSSEKEPIKQTNFPTTSRIYLDFEGKKKYNDWKFTFMPEGQIRSSQTPTQRP
jgi:type II secretory pathway pseudopilin PulG